MIRRLAFAATLAAASAASSAQDNETAQPVALVDNGFCTGPTWITLLPGESVARDLGPDFYVYRVAGPADRQWGMYLGSHSPVEPDRAHRLVKRDGGSVFRAVTSEGGFAGYFVVAEDRTQNHFFGNVFTDEPADKAFFDRVDLGRVARAKCEASRPR